MTDDDGRCKGKKSQKQKDIEFYGRKKREKQFFFRLKNLWNVNTLNVFEENKTIEIWMNKMFELLRLLLLLLLQQQQ